MAIMNRDASQVVQCESGGNPSAVSPYSGGGLYGILDSSWQAYGGTAHAPHPYDASASQQGAIAHKILALQGPGAWQCWSSKPHLEVVAIGRGSPTGVARARSETLGVITASGDRAPLPRAITTYGDRALLPRVVWSRGSCCCSGLEVLCGWWSAQLDRAGLYALAAATAAHCVGL